MTTATTNKRRSSRATKSSATNAGSSKPATKKTKHYTRPGVEAAVRLVALQPITHNVVDTWERASSHYSAMIKAKGGANLVKLDKRREDLAKRWRMANSEKRAMTKDQLLNVIIGWKFGKGKPRNALKPMLNSNSEASVTNAAAGAFEIADGVPENDTSGEYTNQKSSAIKELCELKGVGPATASAVLSLYRPDIFAFMDDEVIECLYDKKRGYTLKIYMEVNDRCSELAAELNLARRRGEDESSEWTPYNVGRALWTLATMSATSDEDGISAIFNDDEALNSRKKIKKS